MDTLKKVEIILESLDKVNSSFPLTKEFLGSVGVKRVSELDEIQRMLLQEYLFHVT